MQEIVKMKPAQLVEAFQAGMGVNDHEAFGRMLYMIDAVRERIPCTKREAIELAIVNKAWTRDDLEAVTDQQLSETRAMLRDAFDAWVGVRP